MLELWLRVKSHIPPKERLEVADIFVSVFDVYGPFDESILDEDLDKEMRAAVKSYLLDNETASDDYYKYDDDSHGF